MVHLNDSGAVSTERFYHASFDIIGAHTQGYLDLLGSLRGFVITPDELRMRTCEASLHNWSEPSLGLTANRRPAFESP